MALGAFGAHGLEKQLQQLGRDGESRAARWRGSRRRVRYHLYHALAHARRRRAGGASAERLACRPRLALFVLGIALFSGSLYAMTFAGDAWRKLGMVTPLGGLAFIVGLGAAWPSRAWRAP